MCRPSYRHFDEHYAEHRGKSWIGGIITHMTSGPVVAMVWEGLEAVKIGRRMLGATKPL